MLTMSGKGDTWKAIILGMLAMIFIAEILFLSVHGLAPVPTINPLTGKIMTPVAPAAPKAWYPVSLTKLVDRSFDLQGWDGMNFTSRDPGTFRRVEGVEMAASRPVAFAVLDDSNMERLKSGYPPISLFASGNRTSVFSPPAGSWWLVFYVLPSQDRPSPIPTSTLGMGLFILRALQENQPARVTVQVVESMKAYTDEATAVAALKASAHRSPSADSSTGCFDMSKPGPPVPAPCSRQSLPSVTLPR